MGRVKIKNCSCGYHDVIIIENTTFMHRCPNCGITEPMVPKYELKILELEKEMVIQNLNHRKQTLNVLSSVYG